MASGLAVLTQVAFLQIVRHDITTPYNGGRIQQAREGRGNLVPLNKHIWTLFEAYGIIGVLSYFDVDPTQKFLALS